MNIHIKIKINWKEYELTPEWDRKPTDDVEIEINLDNKEEKSK